MDALDERMKTIRQGYCYEGEVLYFLDSESTVIGLLKKKTIWYIVCRAIREKLRAACHVSGIFKNFKCIVIKKKIVEMHMFR